MRRAEAVEYGRFCMIQIWELQNDLAAGWPSVSFAHISGLHAASMQKIDLGLEKWVSDYALTDAPQEFERKAHSIRAP